MNSGNFISSAQNQRVKDAARLRERRGRSKQERFLIDGARELSLAIHADIPLVEAFVCEQLCHTPASQTTLEELREAGVKLWRVTPEVFSKLAFGDRAEGVLGVATPPARRLNDLSPPDGALLCVLAGLEKPGNVGAVLRSADGAGVSAVIVADAETDLYNPNCIRASLGAIFTLQVCAAGAEETLAWLRQGGYQIFAARVDATRMYDEADFTGAAAVVLGSEAKGLSPAWNAAAVTAIKLPMRGRVDSLNVSAAAAVLFYEAERQRSKSGN